MADPTFTDQNTGTTYTSDGGMYYRDSLGTVFTTPQGKSYFGTEPSGSFGQSNYVDSSGTNSGSSYTDSLGNTNFNFNNTPKSSYSPIPYTNSNRTEQSSYTKIATPSCPQNSYYDGVSTCKCNYGYENQGLYCVLKAVSPSCPLYSHRSGDLKTCVCDLGFQMDKNSNICNRIQHESLNSVIPAQKNNTVNFSDSKNRGNLNYDQFAEAIKGAYPEYNHIDNQTLGQV